MINLSTPNEQLLKELKTDYNRVRLWFMEKKHTKKQVRQLAYALERKCIDGGLDYATSTPEEYITKSGNRWIAYMLARRHGKDTIVHSLQSFCFYETYGSMGIFLPCRDYDARIMSCAIFTSHFFLRMKQRLGLGVMNKDVLKRFIEYIHILSFEERDGDTHGGCEVEVYLFGAVGRGIYRDEEKNILEVKTFIPETELSNAQRKRMRELKNMATNFVDMRQEIVVRRILNNDADGVWEDLGKNAKILGGGPDMYFKLAWVFWLIDCILYKHDLEPTPDKINRWLSDNLDQYPSVHGMILGKGWKCDEAELVKLAGRAVCDISGRTFTPSEIDEGYGMYSDFLRDAFREHYNRKRGKGVLQ